MLHRIYALAFIIGIVCISCVHNNQKSSMTQDVSINQKGILFIKLVDVSNGGKSYQTIHNTEQVGSKYIFKNPKFYSQDSKDIIFIAILPDEQKAKIQIPSGKGFKSAKIIKHDIEEPLRVNVNVILNKIMGTNDVTYLDTDIMILPVITESGTYLSMNENDIKMVNERLKMNNLNMQIFSSENGLELQKK